MVSGRGGAAAMVKIALNSIGVAVALFVFVCTQSSGT
jgi:hypothetical protein